MRTVIVVAVLALGGFFFFGIYWPKHKHQVAIDNSAAVVDRYRADVTARDADLVAIVKTLGTLELHPASPLVPDGGTYTLVMAGDLRKRAGLPAGPTEPSLGDRVYIDQVMSLVEHNRRFGPDGPPNDEADMAEMLIAPMAKLRYAVILDTLAYRAPQMQGQNSFTPGMFSANAYFFDVPARKYIAGWLVTAESSGSVGQRGVFQGGIALDSDLEQSIKSSITQGIRTKVTGQ